MHRLATRSRVTPALSSHSSPPSGSLLSPIFGGQSNCQPMIPALCDVGPPGKYCDFVKERVGHVLGVYWTMYGQQSP